MSIVVLSLMLNPDNFRLGTVWVTRFPGVTPAIIPMPRNVPFPSRYIMLWSHMEFHQLSSPYDSLPTHNICLKVRVRVAWKARVRVPWKCCKMCSRCQQFINKNLRSNCPPSAQNLKKRCDSKTYYDNFTLIFASFS